MSDYKSLSNFQMSIIELKKIFRISIEQVRKIFDVMDEVYEEEEEYGIGCNKCYSCVSGGAGPCVLDREKEQTNISCN